MKQLIQSIITMARPFMGLAAPQAHAAIDRVLTIPSKDRQKLYVGMSDEDKTHAEVLYREHVDKTTDWVVFVASRGEIEED